MSHGRAHGLAVGRLQPTHYLMTEHAAGCEAGQRQLLHVAAAESAERHGDLSAVGGNRGLGHVDQAQAPPTVGDDRLHR